MAKISTRKETGRLLFDFTYRGVRCREQTTLEDSPLNRKRLQPILKRLKQELADGSFKYSALFPGSAMVAKFEGPVAPSYTAPVASANSPHQQVLKTESFRRFVERWVQEHQIEWRRSHLKSLQSTIDTHLIGYFQDKPIGEIKREDIMAFRNHLAALPGRGDKACLSNKRINGILGPLRQILESAADQYGFTSPLVNYKPLKVRKADVNPFSLTEVQRIIAACRPDFKDYMTIRFLTGMRTGEAHGLKWKYVDFDRRYILIRETQVLGEDEYTKTDQSQRDIQMSQPVFEALKRMYEATGRWSEYVFCNRQGKPLDNKNFTDRVWYPLLRHVGLEQRRPYQMRHTAATLWLASGESPEWISKQLGHGSTEMLFRVYSRYVPNITRQDGSAIDRLLSSRFACGDISINSPTAHVDGHVRAGQTHSHGPASASKPDAHGPPGMGRARGFSDSRERAFF